MTLRHQILFIPVLGFVVVGLFQNCSKAKFTSILDESAKNRTTLTSSAHWCAIDKFNQPKDDRVKKLDIVFVTDTSGSLNSEREGIGKNVLSLIERLPKDIDYNIGVLLAHGSTSKQAGVLYQSRDENVILKSSELPKETLRDMLWSKLQKVRGHRDSDGGEEGLYSLTQMLTGAKAATAKSLGIGRDDTALSVIFISDENDICARYPDGITPVPDGNKLEGPAFKRDCAQITPESTLKALNEFKSPLAPLIMGGIVYTGENKLPRGGENEIGYGYIETIKLANGVVTDISSSDIAENLSVIGSIALKKIKLITEYELPSTVLKETILVHIDGKKVNHDSPEGAQLIHLTEPGQPSSQVQLEYCFDGQGDLPHPVTEDGTNCFQTDRYGGTSTCYYRAQ